jgi:putative salt-induced outer membrane protein YdiY
MRAGTERPSARPAAESEANQQLNNTMSSQRAQRTFGSAAVVAAGLCAAPFLIGAGSAQAQQPAAAPAPPPPKPWQNKITAGVTLSQGNSDSVMATISAESKRKWEHDELFLNAAFGYGKTTTKNYDQATDTTTETTAKSDDYLTAGAQWNHLFTPKLYGGLKLDFRHDDVADLDYRFTVGPLVGYYFIKTAQDTLSGEIGPGWVYEKQGGETQDYFTIRIGERYEHKFGSKARFWESVEYLPQVDDWANNYIINAEAGIETSITKSVSLRLVAQDTYDNQPAPGREKNDFKLIAALSYSFGF